MMALDEIGHARLDPTVHLHAQLGVLDEGDAPALEAVRQPLHHLRVVAAEIGEERAVQGGGGALEELRDGGCVEQPALGLLHLRGEDGIRGEAALEVGA